MMYLLIIGLSAVCGLAVYIAAKWVIKEGVRDDLAFPLDNCYYSVLDENQAMAAPLEVVVGVVEDEQKIEC